MVLRKWLSSLTNRSRTDRARRRTPNQVQREMQAAPQLVAEALETRQVLSAVIAGIETDHGVDAQDEITNSGTFELEGTATGNSVLQITRNGSFVGAILVNGDGAWRFAQTNLAEGTYEFAADDGSGSSAVTVQVDLTAPTATLTTSLTGPTNAATLPISLSFSEAVDGLSLSDLAIGNGTASNLSGSGTSYTFDVTPAGDGAVTIALNASTITDLAGNNNGLSATLSIDSDRTAPAAPSVSNPSTSSLTNGATATISGSADAGSLVRLYNDADGSGSLNEGDTLADQQQLGSGDSNFSFNASLAANSDNRFVVTAVDAATNESSASAVPTITQDSTGPSASIAFGIAGPTNATSIPVTINFSESVSGFDASDVSVGNGTLSDFTTVSPTQATFNVAPAADGNVTIDIAGAATSDAAGNASVAATQASIVSDTTKPTVSFTPTLSAATNSSPLRVSVQFNEDVAGLDLSDLSITSGSASNLTGSGSSYSFDLTPTSDGAVVVSLSANAVADGASNTNNSAEYQIQSDRTAPGTPSVASPAAATLTSAVSITISGALAAAEDTLVRIYRESDGSIAGEQLLLGGSTEFSISVALTANSSDRFLVVSRDSAGNESANVATPLITQDSQAPVTTLAIAGANPSNAATLSGSVSFNEDVSGFTVEDVNVDNATLSNFVAVDGSHFTFDLTPTADGTVTISVASDAASDGAGNANGAASTSTVSDRTAPDVSLMAPAGPTNSASLDFSITSTEAISGLTSEDFNVSNGSITSLTGSGNEYHLVVTPTADGEVSVSLADDAATDAAGNTSNEASASTTSDRSAPSVSISSNLSGLTNAAAIPVTVTISEVGSDFNVEDIVISNGTLSEFAGSGTSFSFLVTPTSDGVVTVEVAAHTVYDAATNSNGDAASFSTVSDRTAPTFNLNALSDVHVEGQPIYAELGISDASAITALNWSAGGEGPIFTSYLGNTPDNLVSWINFTPLDNGTYQARLTATDAAGNTASADVIAEIDNVDPTASTDAVTTSEDDVIEGGALLSNDFDPAGENDSLTVVGFDEFSEYGASVYVVSDGSFSYNATMSEGLQSLGAGEAVIDTFGYTITDGDGGESTGTVRVEVQGANDAPVLNDSTAVRLDAIDANDIYNRGVDVETFAFDRIDEVDSNDSVGIAVIGFSRATTRGDWQYSTDGGESWTAIESVSSSNALHLVADGQTRLRLRPDGSHTGTARLTVRAWDGSNEASNGGHATISCTGGTSAYSEDSLTLRQTVLSAARDATIAVSDTFEADAGGYVSGNVLDNDVDPDTSREDLGVHFESNLDLGLLGRMFDAPEELLPVAITHFGALSHNIDGSFNYEAEPTFFASLAEGETVLDGFTYFATDGRSTSNVAGVSIVLTGVNDTPFTTTELDDVIAEDGQHFYMSLPGGLFEDVDNGDWLTLTATLANGDDLPEWLGFSEGHMSFQGLPGESDVGELTLLVTATDSYGESASIEFDLEVIDVNHAPIARDYGNFQLTEGDEVQLLLSSLFYDSDVGDSLTLSFTDGDGEPLSDIFEFDADTNALYITTDNDSAGTYTVVMTATDPDGASASSEFELLVVESMVTLEINGSESDPNETWFAFVDDDGLLHIQRNGVDATEPLPIEQVMGVKLNTGDGDDVVVVDASLNVVVAGDDHEGDGDDEHDEGGLFINLGAGNDSVDLSAVLFGAVVFGGEGNDLLIGSSASDFLLGDAGNDTLIGGGGDDLLIGGDGNDTLRGGAGSDALDGGADNDVVLGQGGGDLLLGGTGNDTVDGGVGNDSIIGNDGDDALLGGSGNDTLIGAAGNDTLSGNDGSDTLIGGTGADRVDGGTGLYDLGLGGQGDVTIREGSGVADVGDSLTTNIETVNETFDVRYDWELPSLRVV